MSDFLKSILPHELHSAFDTLPIDRVYELRLRVNCPVIACVAGRNFFLTNKGISHESSDAVKVSRSDLETIVHKASNYSIYAVNEQIKQGFITIHGGVRIGLCGEVVAENGEIITIKNISSLNIRIPHQIWGCSFGVLPYVFDKHRPLNTLIISPPGAGKTTFLRDLAWQISDKYHLLNTLVLDERGEIAAAHLGENQLDVGESTDVLTCCSKMFGFGNGIRSMRPDVIITDEIATTEDIMMVSLAARSGVAVIASVHAGNIDEIRTKPGFCDLVTNKIFDRYVVLGIKDSAGTILGVYDKNLKLITL